MQNKPGNEPTARKSRQLNVIYFVDSARTRSFRVSLTLVNALLVFLMALLIWAIVSVIVLVALGNDRQELSVRFTEAQNTIFKYETTYDSAYEVAYAKSNFDKKDGVIASEESDDEITDAEANDTEEKPDEEVTKVDKPVTKIVKNPKMALSTNAVKQENSIDVVDARATLLNKDLKLAFKILNTNSPRRIAGRVHAIAEFIHADGRKEFFGAPTGIEVNAAGIAQNPQEAYRFSIRRYKVKKFLFKLPEQIKGNIKEIRIELTTEEGTIVGLFKVPVNLKVK